MRLSLLMAVMYVMGRLGIWKPYLRFIEVFLSYLDNAVYEEIGPLWQESLFDLEAGVYE